MSKQGFQSKEVGCFNRVEGNTKAELLYGNFLLVVHGKEEKKRREKVSRSCGGVLKEDSSEEFCVCTLLFFY